MVADNQIEILRLTLVAFYGGAFTAVLRRADIWFPFTPTFTAVPGQWVGWQDALRFALSGVFLLLLPALYFVYILMVLMWEPAPFVIHLNPPSAADLKGIRIILLDLFSGRRVGFGLDLRPHYALRSHRMVRQCTGPTYAVTRRLHIARRLTRR